MTTGERNTKNIEGLHPLLHQKAISFIAECHKVGIEVLITQGLRTVEEQNALYAKGRTTAGVIVTQAKGGSSFHNYGLAFDFVPLIDGKPDYDANHPVWKNAISIGKSLGLENGDRGYVDLPHFQIIRGLTPSACLKIHKVGGLKAVWDEFDKRA